jgi:NADH:ubiquinone oxidoreductase subunit H
LAEINRALFYFSEDEPELAPGVNIAYAAGGFASLFWLVFYL